MVLLSYIRRANRLAEHPGFYNALTSNCVTNIVYTAREVNPAARLTWETIFSGYAARQMYRNGRLDTRLPFEELEARSRITDVAKRTGRGPEFSKQIRLGLPVPEPQVGASVKDHEREP